MTKREIILAIGDACPDLTENVLALLKRLDESDCFSGAAAGANEVRFKKLCRDALMTGEFPDNVRFEMEKIESELYTHGGPRPGSGRPPLPDDEVKKPRSIKFSDEEWEDVREKAAELNVTMSEFVRSRVLK